MIRQPWRWNSCDSAREEKRGPLTTTSVAAVRDGVSGTADCGSAQIAAVRVGERRVADAVPGIEEGVRTSPGPVDDLVGHDQRAGRQFDGSASRPPTARRTWRTPSERSAQRFARYGTTCGAKR